MPTLLIVDDEPNVRRALEAALELEGYEVRLAGDAKTALALLDGVDLVLTDMNMPGTSGLELLGEIRSRAPELPVAMMTAHATVDGALAAVQQGAYDYLLKPCQTEEIILKVELGLRLGRYEHELRARNERLEELSSALAKANLELADKNTELERLATTDSLTEVANRRALMAFLEEQVATTRRYASPTSVVLVDLDHFKQVNDRHGHAAGDSVLRTVARIFQERARQTDRVGRIGGEEFAIVLSSTSLEGALQVAEDIRRRIARTEMPPVGHVTASLGVAELAKDETAHRLLTRADAALYAAKEAGRNRVHTALDG